MDQVNCTVQKVWKAIHFIIHVLKKGNSNTRSSAYTSLVCPILEYGSACWDPRKEGQINALDRVQKKTAQFTNHTEGSDWETLAQRRTIAPLRALFKVYSGERAWKIIHDRLQRPYCLRRVDNVQKIRDRKQRVDIGKYFFVNRTIKNWKQLPAEALWTFPYKPKIFRKRVRKAVRSRMK
jgi:hypothetical protein